MSELTYPCELCKKTGELQPGTYVFDGKKMFFKKQGVCPKCGGDGELDWIDNILGKKKIKQPTMIKPGVYSKTIDISNTIPPLSDITIEWNLKEDMGGMTYTTTDSGIIKAEELTEPTIISTAEELLKEYGIPDDTRNKMNRKPEDNEMICNACGGKGIVKNKGLDLLEEQIEGECKKCLGHGYIDYMDNLMGRNRKPELAPLNWTANFGSAPLYMTRTTTSEVDAAEPRSDCTSIFDVKIEDELIKDMSKQISNKIDEMTTAKFLSQWKDAVDNSNKKGG